MKLIRSERDMIKYETLGFDLYDNLGFKGKDIKVFSLESDDGHGASVANLIRDLAPECEFKGMDMNYRFTNGEYISGNIDEVVQAIRDFDADIITNSIFNNIETYPYLLEKMKELVDEGRTFVTLAGNSGNGKDTIRGRAHEVGLTVGALDDTDGIANLEGITRMYYSSTGKEIDFMSFAWTYFAGTSAATPTLCALIVRLMCRYGRKTQTYWQEYLKTMCLDLGEVGFDELTGYGMPTLMLKKGEDMSETIPISKPIQEISDWAKDGQEFVIQTGISDGTRPKDNVAREEHWTMLKRLYDELKK